MEETRRSPWQHFAACRNLTSADRRNANIATAVLFVWGLGFVGASLLLRREVVPAGALAYLTALVPTALGIFAVLAYIRFLRHADELHRKIQLEALALGFGAGFVATFAFELLEAAGLDRADVSSPFSVMVIFYFLGLSIGSRRYA